MNSRQTEGAVDTCHACNGAGSDNNTFCCPVCDGSGGLVTVTLSIPSARRVISALAGKESEWWDKGQEAEDSGMRVYCEIESQSIASILRQLETLVP